MATNRARLTAQQREPTEAEMERATDILAGRQAPDTEHPISVIRREAKKAKPRRRGALVRTGRGNQDRSV